MTMTSTIVFACKSNSCRSQMAEGWAKNWMKNERSQLEARRRTDIITTEGDSQEEVQRDRRLQSFLDGLVVASVALDETSVSPLDVNDRLSSSPTSSLTSFFTRNNSVDTINSTSCVTCDGETCSSPLRRKKVKVKAIKAMAIDGVDISDATPKTIHDVLSSSSGGGGEEQLSLSRCSKSRSFSLLEMLRGVSLQMSLAYAGVVEVEDTPESEDVGTANTLDEQRSVDSLVVLCACADSLKQKLSDMSKETLNWNIDAPTASAKVGEGDMAYLRVSRQIRVKVETFMNHLKESVMNGNLDCCNNNESKSCNTELREQVVKRIV
uniref:Phosphotyrosine protein phosphatase I domain-containing protein n=1 Tax=Skeletonema marinoi TaxID=267567 RepID=A0A6U3TXY9_9STRA|mmetsp:Transcript_15141/g.25549  ORF Transcript_15141/g.25549 Transcript_15141/m.25549 type:complete len:323 (+) Transcript_15141:58-1026(+)